MAAKLRPYLFATLLAPVVLCVLLLLRLIAPPLARWRAYRRRRSGVLSSVWGVTPILTLPLLARADELLGLRSETVVYQTYYITRTFDRNFSGSASWFSKWAPDLYRWYCEIVFLLMLPRYDIYHYFNDRGLMQPEGRFGISPRELQYLQRTGRQLYTYAYGADVRERRATLALGDWNFCRECDDPGRYCICDAGELAKSIQPVSDVAKAMSAMGDMLTYVPNANNMHYWPIDTSRLATSKRASSAKRAGGRLLVAHAPNHGHFKGTRYVQQAVDSLRLQGLDIELRFVQGAPNLEVLALFSQADLVIDQLVGGFYGYTALEAMALGKPVISYVRSPDLALPGCPIINATPETIEQVLRDVYEGRHDLDALGREGRAYVQAKNSIEAVAARLADMYLRTATLPPVVRDNLQRTLASLSLGAMPEAPGVVGAAA